MGSTGAFGGRAADGTSAHQIGVARRAVVVKNGQVGAFVLGRGLDGLGVPLEGLLVLLGGEQLVTGLLGLFSALGPLLYRGRSARVTGALLCARVCKSAAVGSDAMCACARVTWCESECTGTLASGATSAAAFSAAGAGAGAAVGAAAAFSALVPALALALALLAPTLALAALLPLPLLPPPLLLPLLLTA